MKKAIELIYDYGTLAKFNDSYTLIFDQQRILEA
mgnify:FL=1